MITDRRSVLAGLALIAATPAAFAQATKSAGTAMAPAMMNPADVKTASQYYMGVIGPAELSLVTSQLGVDMATGPDAHEFAGFELGEAITVNMVLKDLGATAPAMDAEAMATVETIKTAEKGAAFDRAYIDFQLANHEYLRDLADGYLHNTAGTSDAEEKHGRHMASLMLAVFKERRLSRSVPAS